MSSSRMQFSRESSDNEIIIHMHIGFFIKFKFDLASLPIMFFIRAAGDIKDGQNGDVADDHYHRYMVLQNQQTDNL